VKPRWADVGIGDVRPSAVRSWVAELAADGVGAASIEAALMVLHGALDVAVLDRQLAGSEHPHTAKSRRLWRHVAGWRGGLADERPPRCCRS